MNRRDAALVVLVLIAALAGFALMLTQTGQGAQVKIAVNGEVYGIYDLDTDQTIEIGEKTSAGSKTEPRGWNGRTARINCAYTTARSAETMRLSYVFRTV